MKNSRLAQVDNLQSRGHGREVCGEIDPLIPYILIIYLDENIYTVMLIEMPRFSVAKLLLHHYKSDLAHISDLYSLVIGLYKSEI